MKFLIHTTIFITFDDVMLNEINQLENTKFLPLHIFIVLRSAKFVKLEDRMVYSASERKAEQKPVQ